MQGVGLGADRAWQLHQASGGRPGAGTLPAPELVFALGRPAALCCPAGLRAAPLTPIGRGEPLARPGGLAPPGGGWRNARAAAACQVLPPQVAGT